MAGQEKRIDLMDRPILFQAEMVRAILREIELLGSGKTQTRRVLKPQPREVDRAGRWYPMTGGGVSLNCYNAPYVVRDRLWARENFYLTDQGDFEIPVFATDQKVSDKHIKYVRSIASQYNFSDDWLRGHILLRPSIHMPRWASRITLNVIDVRFQRVQDISETDAVAEGIQRDNETMSYWGASGAGVGGATRRFNSARGAFRDLWDKINAKRGFGWDANPWVVAVTFKSDLRNIDL